MFCRLAMAGPSAAAMSVARSTCNGSPAAAAARLASRGRCCAAVVDKPYAVIDVGGSQQFVEEGSWFACSSRELQATAPGARIQFDKVVALRSDGQFVRGRPYLANVLVEGMLVEEFAAPAANSENAPSPPQLGKVLVTRIRHSEESLRLLEEAFLGLQA